MKKLRFRRSRRVQTDDVIVCASVSQRARSESLQPADARQERLKAAVARVYDTSVLRRIEISIATSGSAALP